MAKESGGVTLTKLQFYRKPENIRVHTDTVPWLGPKVEMVRIESAQTTWLTLQISMSC